MRSGLEAAGCGAARYSHTSSPLLDAEADAASPAAKEEDDEGADKPPVLPPSDEDESTSTAR